MKSNRTEQGSLWTIISENKSAFEFRFFAFRIAKRMRRIIGR